ncbi:2-(1,2-epoxy-1,2-dihydrophenyl)acetyl-CoA isomerase PaaG [Variovorax sp. J31P179]|uniref:enoyl-CoA hydratase-related protein n=1 Tax=Variovorax sp. J31P179 TaxID=3053508 RepID=UPI0025789C07|nr:enoyl-CoA hydratase-related protein [Variovorax sp. J31P179]MDM0081569.1 2-(1,2-epoxy-1,2-dihydrophenyl)acetyl-CoA isomerase PaaG [Variovorax sp. J31P179]
MSDSLVLATQQGPVLTLTLNRPAALNSFTEGMHQALRAGLDAAAANPEVRCVVLTGAGRGFCAGQDLADPMVAPAAPGEPPKDLAVAINTLYKPLVQRLKSMPVPVIAAVNGVAAGAGANLALNCDFVLAGQSASFIQAFAKIGLVPDTGGTWLLPRIVGRARALGLAMLGDKLPAAEAERIGLIWKCVDDAALADECAKLAQRLAAMPAKALAATRAAIDGAQALTLDQALDMEAALQSQLGSAHDYLEGVAAFGAKRAPVFTDR